MKITMTELTAMIQEAIVNELTSAEKATQSAKVKTQIEDLQKTISAKKEQKQDVTSDQARMKSLHDQLKKITQIKIPPKTNESVIAESRTGDFMMWIEELSDADRKKIAASLKIPDVKFDKLKPADMEKVIDYYLRTVIKEATEPKVWKQRNPDGSIVSAKRVDSFSDEMDAEKALKKNINGRFYRKVGNKYVVYEYPKDVKESVVKKTVTEAVEPAYIKQMKADAQAEMKKLEKNRKTPHEDILKARAYGMKAEYLQSSWDRWNATYLSKPKEWIPWNSNDFGVGQEVRFMMNPTQRNASTIGGTVKGYNKNNVQVSSMGKIWSVPKEFVAVNVKDATPKESQVEIEEYGKTILVHNFPVEELDPYDQLMYCDNVEKEGPTTYRFDGVYPETKKKFVNAIKIAAEKR